MEIPQKIINLAAEFDAQEKERKRTAKELQRQRGQEDEARTKQWSAANNENADTVFKWVQNFEKSKVGQTLLKRSHPPTAYENIFFFDGHIEGKDWVGFMVQKGHGLCLSDGGKYSQLTRTYVENAKDLAASVDPAVLGEVVLWIKDGRVWDCIERRFR